MFDTRDWQGDVRPGGHWRASGMAKGKPYVLQGIFTEVKRPHSLAHTWRLARGESTVTYKLEPIEGGTRISLSHTGLVPRQVCAATATGWETSFEELAKILAR